MRLLLAAATKDRREIVEARDKSLRAGLNIKTEKSSLPAKTERL
jgi:hypothetical protein